jgi:hypothetical protein
MLKKSIQLLLIYFVIKILYQLINNGDIRWIENILIGFFMFLFLLLFHWAGKPYKWKKGHH